MVPRLTHTPLAPGASCRRLRVASIAHRAGATLPVIQLASSVDIKRCNATLRAHLFLEVTELTGKARAVSCDVPVHVPLSQNVHIRVVQFERCQGLRHQRGSWPVVRGVHRNWVLYQPCIAVPTPGVFTCSVFVSTARQSCLRRSP